MDGLKYLGAIVNANNNRSEEIGERIRTGNIIYWRYKKVLKNKTTKLKIHDIAINPGVTYVCSGNNVYMKQGRPNLRMFKRKLLKKIRRTN